MDWRRGSPVLVRPVLTLRSGHRHLCAQNLAEELSGQIGEKEPAFSCTGEQKRTERRDANHGVSTAGHQ